jgi:hypothetical protein
VRAVRSQGCRRLAAHEAKASPPTTGRPRTHSYSSSWTDGDHAGGIHSLGVVHANCCAAIRGGLAFLRLLRHGTTPTGR